MKYTKVPPTLPGWYWLKWTEQSEGVIVRVHLSKKDGKLRYSRAGNLWEVKFSYAWSRTELEEPDEWEPDLP